MSQPSWMEAIIQVLRNESPLHFREIARRIVEGGIKTTTAKDPPSVVASTITTSLKSDGTSSPFVWVERGVYGLSAQVASNSPVAAFGAHWQRDRVHWATTPRLFGRRREPRSHRVNLTDQRGIYLLHDSRGVLYVGMAIDQGIGSRLSQHTKDRLAGRWDSFSWFGTRPILDNGKLGKAVDSTLTDDLIAVVEDLLIEAIEPRQNKAGGCRGVEYLQASDPR